MKKKVLTMLLAGLLAIGLMTGCGNSNAEEKAEKTPAASKEVAEEVDTSFITEIKSCGEKGDDIETVAYIPMATSNPMFQAMADTVVAQLQDAGFEAEYSSPEFDPAAQLEIFENYVTQGVDCIIVFPINADSMNNAVKEAREKGIKVICQVNPTEECDGWVGSSGVDMGKGTCEAASQWVDQKFTDAKDGEVKCAVITTRTDVNTSEISDEMEKIEKFNSKIKVETVVETTDTSMEAGQALAENLYMTNPDINLVIVEEPDVAVGMNTYYAGTDSPLEDPSVFGIFANNGHGNVYDLIKASTDDSELLRGISSVAPVKYGCQMMTNIVIRISNGEEGDVNFEADPVYLITPENIDAFMSI